MSGLPFPEGHYELFADDDDVIGDTVARTYPKGWSIVRPVTGKRPDVPICTAFDEFEVGQFLARCLSNHAAVQAFLDEQEAAA